MIAKETKLLFVVVGVLLCVISTCDALDNGLGLVPPLGWNTWCTLGPCGRDYCDETEIKDIADTLVSSGLRDLGWTYVNLDDCWGGHRSSNGTMQPDFARFPSGMASTANFLHARGLKFGLYTDAGEYTCSQGGRSFQIPGSYGHYSLDAATYASWGMDYVKMDWCNTKVNGTQLRPEIQYPQMSRALNATDREIYFESCEWGTDDPWKWMRPFANSWRATGDHHDEWSSTAGIIEAVASLGNFAGPGGWNYLDFLMTGGQGCPSYQPGVRCPGQTDTEYVTEFSMWVMAASPLIVATDLRNMSLIQKQILMNTEMLAVHQDPLGHAGNRLAVDATCGNANECQIWGRLLFDGSYYVVLYNADDVTHSIMVSFNATLGWPDVEVYVRDLFLHQTLGTFVDSFTSMNVASHGVTALKVWFTE